RPDSKRFAWRLGPDGPRKHRGGPQGHAGRHELAAAAIDAVLHIRSFCAVCALRFFEYAGLDCPAPCCSCCRPLLTTLGLAAWPATRSCAAGRTACFSTGWLLLRATARGARRRPRNAPAPRRYAARAKARRCARVRECARNAWV